ncbi:hypothetical protein AJ80_07996 [Polytolypa hystricis UAMH7299]|uniref:Uncharacterized protein n=1 Tax=Polytolypa hystricis (strain UAMH7299) TaxID=1447883 RepID=A0A2B7XF78_POLH7|nr:hypothetical protein AJ80_07996 [Polytolypa hystricis UAMH7299]
MKREERIAKLDAFLKLSDEERETSTLLDEVMQSLKPAWLIIVKYYDFHSAYIIKWALVLETPDASNDGTITIDDINGRFFDGPIAGSRVQFQDARELKIMKIRGDHVRHVFMAARMEDGDFNGPDCQKLAIRSILRKALKKCGVSEAEIMEIDHWANGL